MTHFQLIIKNNRFFFCQNLKERIFKKRIQYSYVVIVVILKLTLGLSSAEVLSIPQYSRFQNEPKSLLSTESEELNKALVLTLARAIHVTGSETLSASWIKEILSSIMQNTPISWSSFTLLCFPNVISEFYQQFPVQKENKAQLKRSVEEEYRKWKTMSNENDMLKHFSLQESCL
jgi:mediator of RNA polymerase II transcription subunit 23